MSRETFLFSITFFCKGKYIFILYRLCIEKLLIKRNKNNRVKLYRNSFRKDFTPTTHHVVFTSTLHKEAITFKYFYLITLLDLEVSSLYQNQTLVITVKNTFSEHAKTG